MSMREKPYNQIDHAHCWEQKQPPACGLKGEHKVCCLCRTMKEEICGKVIGTSPNYGKHKINPTAEDLKGDFEIRCGNVPPCPLHTMKEKEESWESRFIDEFGLELPELQARKEVHDFIAAELLIAYNKGYEQGKQDRKQD